MALDAVPDINIIKYLPEYLDGLFHMLSDRNKEIVQMTETLLGELKRCRYAVASLPLRFPPLSVMGSWEHVKSQPVPAPDTHSTPQHAPATHPLCTRRAYARAGCHKDAHPFFSFFFFFFFTMASTL